MSFRALVSALALAAAVVLCATDRHGWRARFRMRPRGAARAALAGAPVAGVLAGLAPRADGWSGWLQVAQGGLYTLGVDTDAAVSVALDGWPVVTHWGPHARLPRYGRVVLAPGWHALEVAQVEPGPAPALTWARAGEPLAPVAPALLAHDPFEPKRTAAPDPRPPPGWWWRDERAGEVIAEGTGAPVISDGAVRRVWDTTLELDQPARLKAPPVAQVEVDGAAQGDAWLPLGAGTHRVRLVTDGRVVAPPELALAAAAHGAGPPDARALAVADDLTSEPERAVLAEEVLPALDGRAGARLATPYVTRWRGERDGHPGVLAPLDARFEARFDAGAAGLHTFALVGGGELVLRVGSHQLRKPAGVRTAAFVVELGGSVPITVVAQDPRPEREVRLAWAPPGGALAPLPAERVTPPGGGARGLAVAAALAATAVCGVLLAPGGWRAHARFVRGTALAHAWVLCVVLGAGLRLHDYARVPAFGETDDEVYAHTIGNALHQGWAAPVGWEFRLAFPVSEPVPLHGRLFRMVAPAVFYPPGMPWLIGLVNRWAGARTLFDMHLEATRLVPVACSTLALALTGPVGRALGFRPPALLAATAFQAAYPLAVVQSRLIKEEALLAVLYLLVVWLLAGARRGGRWRPRAAGALIVACLLVKQTGLAAGVLAVVASLRARRFRAAGFYALCTVLGELLFWWYGAAYAGSTFFEMQKRLMGYADHLDVLLPLLTESRMAGERVGGAWLLWLWLAFAAYSVRRGPRLPVVAVISYLLVLAPTYPATRPFGWYRMPIVPLLCLTAGAELVALLRRTDPFRTLLAVGLLLLPAMHTYGLRATDPAVLWLMRALLIGSGLAALLRRHVPGPVRATAAAALMLAVLIFWASISWRWDALFPATWPADPVIGERGKP